YNVFETTVTAVAEKKDRSKKTLSQKDFLKAPGAQGDPVKAVQNLPGIANQSFSAQIVIQGSEPDDTRYALNGHEIPIVFHFGGLSSVVFPEAIEEVEYLASGFGPEFGRATGGIINLKTRKPKSDRLNALGFVDLYNSGGLIEGPLSEKSSAVFSARKSYIGSVIEKVTEDNEAFDLTVAPEFSDVYFNYFYDLTETDKLDILAIRSEDELKFILNEPVSSNPNIRGTFYQNTTFYRVIPRWRKKINDKTSMDVSLGYGDNNILVEIGDYYFDLETTTFSQRAEVITRHSETYSSTIGLDAQKVNFDVGISFPTRNFSTGTGSGDLTISEQSGESWNKSLYLRNKINFTGERSKKFTFYPNFRLTEFTTTNEKYLMPRWSLNYQANPTLSYYFSTGLYYQPPQNGEATEDFGNPELNSERAIHYTLGLEKDFRGGGSNGFILNLDVFSKKLDQLIISTTRNNDDGEPLIYSNEGTGTINGFQSLLKWVKDEFTFISSYTYLKSTRKNPNEPEYPSEFDQTHNLNLIASYERSRWTYSARFRYVTGNPVTPVDSSIYDADNDVYVPIEGRKFSERYDPFLQLDIRFDRKWIYNNWILSAYLDIQNITSNENVQNYNYNYDYSEFTKTSGLPLLPIFGIKGEY
ncbi:TonB-dependent receptor, partial [Bacteriovoracaceae bacterium]|nr:TonB-dependent receptor [Bacteriovoracaceae bacterium]